MVNRRMCFRRLGHFVAGVLGIFYFGVDTKIILLLLRHYLMLIMLQLVITHMVRYI